MILTYQEVSNRVQLSEWTFPTKYFFRMNTVVSNHILLTLFLKFHDLAQLLHIFYPICNCRQWKNQILIKKIRAADHHGHPAYTHIHRYYDSPPDFHHNIYWSYSSDSDQNERTFPGDLNWQEWQLSGNDSGSLWQVKWRSLDLTMYLTAKIN